MSKPSPQSNTNQTSQNSPLRELNTYSLTGRCPCSAVTYTLSSAPLIVHACHCTYCQRETGSSFALNAIYEPYRVKLTGRITASELLLKTIPTASSKEGQIMVRCPECYTVVWSHYAAGGPLVIVRVGTVDGVIDETGRYVANGGLRPNAHIFAGQEKRHRWLDIPPREVVYEGYGPREEYWPKESLERLEVFTRQNEGVKAFSVSREA